MSAVWYIGQAAKRTVGTADWASFGIVGQAAVTWEASNGWSVSHGDLSMAQLALLNTDPLFIVGAPDGVRTGMPAGVDAGDYPTKGWTIEQIVQRVGTAGTVADGGIDTKLPGAPGDSGASLPVGGATNSVLTKISDEDGDAEWRQPITKNLPFAVRWEGSAWEYTTLTAAKAAGMQDNQTAWFIGHPSGQAPAWARPGDIVSTP